MLTLFAGAGAARLIGLLSMPLLTRIYSPESYGTLGVFVALTAQIVPLLTLRYVIALPLPRSDRAALTLLGLSLVLISLLASVIFIILALVSAPILRWLNAEAIFAFWWLVPLAAAAMALFELLSLWATRKREYGVIARAQVLQSFFGEGTKIGLGVVGLHPLGLILGQIASQSAGCVTFIFRFRDILASLARQLTLRRLASLARRYRDLPLFRLPSHLLLVFASQAPLLFISALYDIGIAGQFGLAMAAIALPMTLVGRTMSQAYYGEAAAVGRDPDALWRMTVSVQLRLFVFAIPTAAVLAIVAEPLFALVFGDEWRQAGKFTSIMAIFLSLQFTSAPLIQVFNILDKHRAFLLLNFVRVVGLVTLYLAAREAKWAAGGFVWAITGFLCLFYGMITIYILAVLRRQATV